MLILCLLVIVRPQYMTAVNCSSNPEAWLSSTIEGLGVEVTITSRKDPPVDSCDQSSPRMLPGFMHLSGDQPALRALSGPKAPSQGSLAHSTHIAPSDTSPRPMQYAHTRRPVPFEVTTRAPSGSSPLPWNQAPRGVNVAARVRALGGEGSLHVIIPPFRCCSPIHTPRGRMRASLLIARITAP